MMDFLLGRDSLLRLEMSVHVRDILSVFFGSVAYSLSKIPSAARSKGLSPMEPKMAPQVASVMLVGCFTLRMVMMAPAMRRPQKTTM